MRVEKFQLKDYAEIRLLHGVGLEYWGFDTILPILQAMEKGSFWTVREGDKVLAIGGHWVLHDGVCEVSLFPSEEVFKKTRALLKILKIGITDLRNTFRRVQLHCRDERKYVRFAQTLGFEEEGRMRKFGVDGHDHLMMAIVR